jgi:hypothetical protein
MKEARQAERCESARLGVIEEASRRQAAMRGGQPAVQPAMVALPAELSANEKARRELTRYPSASWCIHCIVGKGKELPHRRILADAIAPPDQHMFFAGSCFIKINASVSDAAEQFATTLVVVDKDTGAVAAMSLPSKEATPFATEFVASFIDRCGLIRVTLRTDGEPAMTSLADKVKDKREHGTILQQAP